MQNTHQPSLEHSLKQSQKRERHRTGFSAWKRRSDCSSLREWLRSGYESLTQDGVGAGVVDHSLNIVGFATWGATTAKLYPVLLHYLPVAEKAAQFSASIPDVGKLDEIVETAVEGAVHLSGQGAEAALAGIGALAAGYVMFLAFDWLGDDYRPQRMAGWLWDHTGRGLWERTGQRAIKGVKSGAKRAGRGLKYRTLKIKDRFTKGRSADDYDMAKRFDEAKNYIDEFRSRHITGQDENINDPEGT